MEAAGFKKTLPLRIYGSLLYSAWVPMPRRADPV